jgi:large subunit ribosomal protein L8e
MGKYVQVCIIKETV